MIGRKKAQWTSVLAGLLLATATHGQKAPPGRSEILAAARDVMTAAGFATLITLDSEGHPQARTMMPFPPEENLTVWMATNSSTRKVEQLRRDPRATLHYFDPSGPGYVTLLGRAELISDPEERAKHWNEAWADFYGNGPRGDDFLLIRFRPHRVETISFVHGIATDPKGWRPAIVELGPPSGH